MKKHHVYYSIGSKFACRDIRKQWESRVASPKLGFECVSPECNQVTAASAHSEYHTSDLKNLLHVWVTISKFVSLCL
jgi:hypothetical protein